MKFVAFILAILETAVGVGGIALLISTISADANGIKCLIACLMFMVGSVMAAGSWVKALNIPITPNIKGAK